MATIQASRSSCQKLCGKPGRMRARAQQDAVMVSCLLFVAMLRCMVGGIKERSAHRHRRLSKSGSSAHRHRKIREAVARSCKNAWKVPIRAQTNPTAPATPIHEACETLSSPLSPLFPSPGHPTLSSTENDAMLVRNRSHIKTSALARCRERLNGSRTPCGNQGRAGRFG